MEFKLADGSTGELVRVLNSATDEHGVPCVKIEVVITHTKGYHKEGDHVIHREYIK